MPSFISIPFLLAVIVIGVAVSVFLLLLTIGVRIGRYLFGRRRSRVEEQVRPLVLEAVMGEGVPEEAVAARGRRGRAVERVAFSYLAQVRGEGHDLLADLLERRGAVARVISHSSWPSRQRRASAASQLGLIATADAERQLESLAAGDPSLQVRIVAARGLGKTSEAAAADTLLGLLPDAAVPEGIVASALLELGQEAAPALRHALQTGPGHGPERAMAAEVLGLLDEMTACPELIFCLDDPEPGVRASAVRALGRLGMPQATKAVSGCLAPGEDPAVRAAAARALGRIGDIDAVPALTASLPDPHYWLAHNAAEALALLGPPGREALAGVAAAGSPGAPHAREALSRLRVVAGQPAGQRGGGPQR
jgi:HEAT repeat protein